MSIFSKLKGAKKAADEHKSAKAQTATDAPVKVPYKHVPTHAAIDALSTAPSSFREDDRAAIRVQNKRRSELSRHNSELSATTTINTSMNRNASFISAESVSSRPSKPRLQTKRSHVGFQNQEGYPTSRPPIGKSPLASHEISPVESPSGSSSSSTRSSSSQVLELPTHQQRHTMQANGYDQSQRNSRRRIGPAPWEMVTPAPAAAPQPIVPVPVIPEKRRTWSFMKKSNAIAAH